MFLDLSRRSMLRPMLLVAAGMCGIAGLIIEYGTFPAPWVLVAARVLNGLAVGLFLVEQMVSLRQLGTFRHYIKERWPTFSLSVLLVLEIFTLLAGRETTWLNSTLGYLSMGTVTHAYLIIIQIYIVSVFVVQLPHLHKRFASLHVRPAVAFMVTFIVLIFMGAGLLLLPRATPSDLPLSLLDALFTSTSAVCVTGLIVRDTGSEFTIFGQTVILVLIQLGGLGIMSLTAALSLLLGRGIGVRESSLLREVFQVPMLSAVGRTVRFIILMTVVLEAAGAVGIYLGLEGVIVDRGDRLFTAVFHAVSAFCNAGFSTFDDSLVSLSRQPLVMGTISGLLVIGGLGFGVVAQLLAWMKGRALRQTGRPGRLDLHSRVVLVVSAGLLVVGTATIVLLEWNNSLSGTGSGMKFAQAFFQSATCRTAGFNSMDLTLMNPATLFLMIVLMFIGGAPGSTAGGVKVTTVAIIWANLRSIGRGLNRTRLGKRELEAVHVQRAMLVLSAGLVLAAISLFILLATEEKPFLETAFEVFSALGTVGLSLGMTSVLSPAGRVVITILMFVGRLGPLTLASSLTGASRDPRVRLPRGRILIG